MKRVKANDPHSLYLHGLEQYNKGYYSRAFEYLSRAAELGDAQAHFKLAMVYCLGHGVEKDEKKALHHTEQAAIGGYPEARHNLGCLEIENGRVNRAVKHFIIAAKLGFDNSLEGVKILYEDGLVSKEEFAAALRGHQAAIAATKSPQREVAATLRVSER